MYSKIAFRNVRKSFKDFTVYFITLLLGVCIFYAFNSIAAQANTLDMDEAQQAMMHMLGFAMKGISFVVAIILGFLIIYANRYLIKRRKSEFAVYLTLGMERSRVSLIIVLETMMVGVLSLVCGLVLGVIVSQGMLFVTAGMFKTTVSNFGLTFSFDACMATIVYFAIIFLVMLIFNVATISRYKLINLIQSMKQNETQVIRKIPIAVGLFVVAVICIVIAYWQLISAGNNGGEFGENMLAVCAVLILVGTVLFFYSSGTFLLSVFQSRKKLYYKGVNMFVLRQISSRINTAFVSVSVVCIALFLAIVFVCLGFGLSASLNKALEDATHYDASVSFDVQVPAEMKEMFAMFGIEMDNTEAVAQAKADDYDIATALKRDAPAAGNLIDESMQINYYTTSLTYDALADVADEGAKKYLTDMSGMTLSVVKLSDFNKLREMNGESELSLGADEFVLWADAKSAQDSLKQFGRNKTITLEGKKLTVASEVLVTTPAETSMATSNSGTVVVPDSALPANATLEKVVMNANLKGSSDAERSKSMEQFASTLDEKYSKTSSTTLTMTWPVRSYMTSQKAIAQSSGMSAIVAYLAIYIGLVLMVACAAILALQQMTEALDSAHRYNMLSRIGADGHMLNSALLRQIGAYFFYPFVLAVAHSCLAFWAMKDIFAAFGLKDLVPSVASTIGIVLAIYIVYFVITFLAARAIVFSRQARRVA